MTLYEELTEHGVKPVAWLYTREGCAPSIQLSPFRGKSTMWTETPLIALPDILAALEERDRLREAAKDLLDHPAPDYLPFHLWDNLRAALEQPK